MVASVAELSPEQIERLVEIREERLELRRLYPSQRYIPNGAIEKWINAAGDHDMASGQVRTYLLSGANGVGKTRALSEMLAALVRGPQCDWLRRPLFDKFPRPCRVRVVSSQAALEEGALRELLELLRPDLEPGYPKKAGTTWLSEWRLRNGSRIDAYSWAQGMTTHAGASVDAVLLDEPGPRAIYDEVTARLRAGGPVIWGMTPVDGRGGLSADVAWVFDAIQRAEAGVAGGWTVLYADAEDSCIEHGVRGRVPHRVIADRMERWKHDPAVLKARFFGRHALELGRVLKEWDEARHLYSEGDYTVQPWWPRFGALDYHPSRAQVYSYCILSPFHELLVHRELVSDSLIGELAAELKALHREHGEPQELIIDPLAAVSNPITGTSVLDEFRKHKLNFRTAGPEKSDKPAGINMLRERLRGVAGRPLLRVHEGCALTRAQARKWITDPRTMQPAKADDDTWENLYRITLSLPQYPSEASERAQYQARAFRSPLVV